MDASLLPKKKLCSVCCKSFASNSSLQVHMRVHTKEKPFICNLCGNSFTQKSSLSTHMILHSGKKNFSCSYCEKHFALKIYKTTHEKACRAKPRSEQINNNNECYDSNTYTLTNLSWNRNEKQNYPDVTASDINTHYSDKYINLASDSDKTPMLIQNPSQNFSSSSAPLQVNAINVHHGIAKASEVKVELTHCNEQPTLLNLDDFAKKNKNRNEKPFQCKLCGQMYSQKSSFRTHLILHSGIKNFQCDWCHKKFALKLYKTSHEKSCKKKNAVQVPVQVPVLLGSNLDESHGSVPTQIQSSHPEIVRPNSSMDQVLVSSSNYMDEVEQLISS